MRRAGDNSSWRWALLACLGGILTAIAPGQACAQGDGSLEEPPKKMRWREVWAGADATESGWLIFSGSTIAPFSHIHEQGLRLRVASGYGQYRYAGPRRAIAFNPALSRHVEFAETTKFEAETGFADVLAGFLWRLDPLTLKVFAGASGVGHALSPFDPENLAVGLDWGAKGVVEMWLNIGQDMWGSLDLSWSQAHDTRSARTRVGYRVAPKFSVGIEARLDVDAQGDCDLSWEETAACKEQYRNRYGTATDLLEYTRSGLFGRWEWDGGEISAAAGLSGTILGRDEDPQANPYASVSWIMQY